MQRLVFVDLLRALSVALVLAVHLQGSRLVTAPWYAPWSEFARNGALGVSMFFVISGFLISRQIFARGLRTRREVVDFWIRRISRIWPLLLLTCLLGIVMLALIPSGDALEQRERFTFRGPTGVFDWKFWLSIPTFTFNWLRTLRSSVSPGWGLHWDILWSLSIEEQFYLLYPLAILALDRTWKLSVCLIGTIAIGVLADIWLLRTDHVSFLWLSTNSFVGFASLAMGCLAFLSSQQRKERRRSIDLALLALAIGVGAYVYLTSYFTLPRDCISGPLLISAATALAIGACADLFGTYRDNQRRGWFVLPGKLSYGCYLFHPFVLWLVWDRLDGHSPWVAFAIFFVSTTLLALLSWMVFEEPCRRWILQRARNRTG